MRRTLYVVALFGLILAACHGGAPSDDPPDDSVVVATVADRVIDAGEYRTRYVDFLLETGLPDEPRHRAGFLERLIAEVLVAQGALDAGLSASSAYAFAEERMRRKLLIEAWLHENAYDTIQVRESELQDMFVRMHTSVTARHLYARTRKEADALVERLNRGASFEELAREVFVDTALANNGGHLGTFGFDEMDPAFEDVAFALEPGVVSVPVQTAQGFSIIEVEDRFIQPLLTESMFVERRQDVMRHVRRRRHRQAREVVATQWLGRAAPEYAVRAFGRLLGQVRGERAVDDLGGDVSDDLRGDASPNPGDGDEWLRAPLVMFRSHGGMQRWTVDDFRAQARYTDAAQRASVRTADDLRSFIDGLVVRDALFVAAREQRLGRSPRVVRALGRAMEEWAFEWAWDSLAQSIDVPDDSVRAYYEANPESNEHFTPPAVVRGRLHEAMLDAAARVHIQELLAQQEVAAHPEIVVGLNLLH